MFFRVFLLFIFLTAIAPRTCGKDVPIPRYTINLDASPEERWKEVATDYKDEIKAFSDSFIQLLGDSMKLLAIIGADLGKYFPEPYASEIKCFVKYTNMTPGEMVFWNMYYELTAFGNYHACTSIVAKTPSGTIIHGRNLDYNFHLLRSMIITVDFQQSGQTVYTGTTFAGYVGLLTGQKPNKFTVSLDERNNGGWYQNELEAFKVGTNGLLAFKVRDTLADPKADFEKAVNTLFTSELIAPVYIILGGLNGDEGAVITHNRSSGIDIWRLNSTESRWYLVETNYDHWNPPPSSDNRRDPAMNAMNNIGQGNIDVNSLYKVLSTPPVLNSGTIYTVIMSASNSNLYNGWIRYNN